MATAGSVLIHAVGDVAPRRIEAGKPPGSLFDAVAAKIREADISVCQLERTLSSRGSAEGRDADTDGRAWHSRNHPENVESLVHAGFHLATFASNHCCDWGPDALLDTIDLLHARGIEVVGAGKDIKEAHKPAVFERNGTRIVFLDYNCVLPKDYEAREGKPGCAGIHVSTYYEPEEYQPGTPPRIITIPLEEDVVALEEDIRQAKGKADVVVMSVHWGVHRIPAVLADYEFTIGHRAIDAGVDLILGTHTHVLKGVEVYKDKVIFHNLGNFAFDYEPPDWQPPEGAVKAVRRERQAKYGYAMKIEKRYSIMVRCVVRDKQLWRVSFLPALINDNSEPRFLKPDEPVFDDVVQYLNKLSRDLGSEFRVEGDEVVVLPV